MQTLNVDLGERGYPIYIGPGLLTRPELLTQHLNGRQVLVVSNETVAPLYLDALRTALGNRHQETVILPDGEQYKTLDTLNSIFDALLGHRFDRGCTVVALGGGVVGDIAGFAAASYQRGVDFVQIPTTLLAQVDSSVGGKTAVNHALGKNMIGAFYQPRCVVADTAVLTTLPPRELAAGLAEVIKYGLIADRDFLVWLEQNLDRLLALDADALGEAVRRSCAIKARLVAADEREQGVRALLNLGHTFGHAIETGLGYGEWLHGEAVAAGTVMAADLSARRGWLSDADVERVRALLRRAGLPVAAPAEVSNDDFRRLMAIDKKVQHGRLRLVVLKSLGEGAIVDDTDPAILDATLTACRA